MCESTINSLKNTTGIVALFSYEKKNRQFPIDCIFCAWPLKCGMTPPSRTKSTIKVRSQWKIFAPTSRGERKNCMKFSFWEFEIIFALHMRLGNSLGKKFTKRESKRFYGLFLFAENWYRLSYTNTLKFLW
jgi:hypothetical protein